MKRNDKPSVWRDIFEVLAAFAAFALLLWLFLTAVRSLAEYAGKWYAPKKLEADTVNEEDGVGRVSAAYDVVSPYRGMVRAEQEETALWVYVEGEGTPPEWYRPDEPMAAEWFAEDANISRKDIGCPDYNVESTLWGWDGHCMESWEMEMFARIAYLECRGCSRECQEAVVDAILRLWESEYYSTTLYGTLSAVNEDGTYAYSPYPTMWDEEYDSDILAEMRELCEERFYNAPEYIAPFFRTKHYHADWSVPCYCFPEDNVYFSTFKEGVQ